MAIATFGPSFCCTRTEPTRVSRFLLAHSHKLQTQTRGLSISCRLNSSNSLSPADNNKKYELHEGASPQSRRNGSPVFVQLPEVSTMTGGKVNLRKAMVQSFKAIAAAGLEGIVVEVWWGVVEKDRAGVYDWRCYFDLIDLASNCGLKVGALLAFHQCGPGPGDPKWIPLPQWCLKRLIKIRF